MSLTRQKVLQRLNDQKAKRSPIVGCGADTGISAKLARAGGADLIIIYNSGRYRMAGRGCGRSDALRRCKCDRDGYGVRSATGR